LNVQARRIAIVIPTFKEHQHVMNLLNDLEKQSYRDFIILVVNSNPDDETSELINNYQGKMIVRELKAHPGLYWTGSVNKGLDWIKENEGDALEYCLFINCDTRLNSTFIENYIEAAREKPEAILCSAISRGDRYDSSGVRMRSWMLSVTSHYLIGSVNSKNKHNRFIPVDMLAGRTLLFPIDALYRVGRPNSEMLPHYGADYEFSARAKRIGFPLYVFTDITAEADTSNTGKKAFQIASTLSKRLRYLFDIRSPLNIKYRIRFARLTYPKYAVASGIITLIIKSLVEVFLGKTSYILLKRKHVLD